MKRLPILACATLLGLLAGCSESTPGGPGATGTTGTPTTTTTHKAPGPAHPDPAHPAIGTTSTTATPADTGSITTTRNSTAGNSVIGPAEDTFTLGVPTLSTHIKQGESKNIKISINRGKNFDQDVLLKLSNVPTGVTVAPDAPMLKKSESEVTLTFAAADSAAIGDFTVNVAGQPGSGADAKTSINLTVDEK